MSMTSGCPGAKMAALPLTRGLGTFLVWSTLRFQRNPIMLTTLARKPIAYLERMLSKSFQEVLATPSFNSTRLGPVLAVITTDRHGPGYVRQKVGDTFPPAPLQYGDFCTFA